MVIMLLILLYIGIRIIISSAVAEQVKYKQYLVNWVVGICLIFLMQYIMSAIMYTTKIVDDMLVTSADGETYRIGFGTADGNAAAAVRKIARVNNTFGYALISGLGNAVTLGTGKSDTYKFLHKVLQQYTMHMPI